MPEIILNSCPCCGGDAKYEHTAEGIQEDKSKWVVNCMNCTMSTGVPTRNKGFAAEVWNRRPMSSNELLNKIV